MNTMKNFKISLLFMACSIAACQGSASECRSFKGPFYDACVPERFYNGEDKFCFSKECTSAKFPTKDGNFYLYLFSPRWAENQIEYENEISVKPDEKVISDKEELKDYFSASGEMISKEAITERELLIEKEGVYKRKYHIILSEVSGILVCGIKWPDGLSEKADQEYLLILEKFRKSVVQYADH